MSAGPSCSDDIGSVGVQFKQDAEEIYCESSQGAMAQGERQVKGLLIVARSQKFPFFQTKKTQNRKVPQLPSYELKSPIWKI